MGNRSKTRFRHSWLSQALQQLTDAVVLSTKHLRRASVCSNRQQLLERRVNERCIVGVDAAPRHMTPYRRDYPQFGVGQMGHLDQTVPIRFSPTLTRYGRVRLLA